MVSVITLLVALMLGFVSCHGGSEEAGPASEIASGRGATASVTGTVAYRERVALTDGSTLKVELRDVSYADAEAPLIASQTISDPGLVPIRFRVEYTRDDIDPRNTYSITARITWPDGRLAFINDTVYEVITRGNPNRVDMALVLVQPPADAEWEGQEEGSDWRDWIEVPAPVVSAHLIPNEAGQALRVVYLQSTIEGCARPGDTSGIIDGRFLVMNLTLMQPPETPWRIDCDEGLVELEEVLPILYPLKSGSTYVAVVNGIETTTFTPPDPDLGHTYIAESSIQMTEMVEDNREPGHYQLRVVSGRPSGSCTQYNGYEVARRDPASIEIRITHHQIADPEVMCTKDFPVDETTVPLGPDFKPEDADLIRVNGKPLSSYKSR